MVHDAGKERGFEVEAMSVRMITLSVHGQVRVHELRRGCECFTVFFDQKCWETSARPAARLPKRKRVVNLNKGDAGPRLAPQSIYLLKHHQHGNTRQTSPRKMLTVSTS